MKSINQIKKELAKDGFVYLPGMLKNSKALNSVLSDIKKIVRLRASKIGKSAVFKNDKDLNSLIFKLNKINEKNISFINDVLNSSPSLPNLFNDPKLIKTINHLLKYKNSYLCINNHKFRIQVPGRDEISNLPWHQDSHYNTMSEKNTSIVAWVSLSNINFEQGPVIFKSGSHKLGKLKRVVKYRENGNKIYTVSKKIIKSNQFKEIKYTSEIGDVILIDMNLVHTSGTNKSQTLSKLSAQARYHQAASSNFLMKYSA